MVIPGLLYYTGNTGIYLCTKKSKVRRCAAYPLSGPPTSWLSGRAPRGLAGPEREGANGTPSHARTAWQPWWSMRYERGLVVGSRPDEVAPPNRALPVAVLRDGSQDFLAGGSEGDRGAGGGHGGPKGEPRRPPPEPNPLLGQLAHAGWASSLTATLCLPHTGRSSKRGTPGLRAHSIRTGSGPHSRMQVSPHPRTRQSAPVTCL